jgi:hypothetical protein
MTNRALRTQKADAATDMKVALGSSPALEAPACVTGFDDFAMMGQAIEERGRHLGVAEHGAMPQ